MQRSKCFAVLFSLGDIIACHFPFVSLAMFSQQLHMFLYLVVVCLESLAGSLSTLFLIWLGCVQLSLLSIIVGIWVNLYVNPCHGLLGSGFDGITYFSVVLVRAFSEL